MTLDSTAPPTPTLAQALRFWAWLGCVSFGGPAGQIALMRQELVERKRWMSPQRFQHALNFCTVLPGPEAQQLATYLGWLLHGTWGGVAAGALFVLPAFVLLVALSAAYVAWGQQPWSVALLVGVRAAVAALVLHALWRLAKHALRSPSEAPVRWVLMLAAAAGMGWWGWSFAALVGVAALVGLLLGRWWPRGLGLTATTATPSATNLPHPPCVLDDDTPLPAYAAPSWRHAAAVLAVVLLLWALALGAIAVTQGLHGALAAMALFFTKAAMVTFGGAYAVLPYVNQAAVAQHGWLTAPQMLDGLALGESTPGPLILVVAFVGYLGGAGATGSFAGGFWGAATATFFTFLPSFLFILVGAPWIESTRARPRWQGPLAAIGAVVLGGMAWLGLTLLASVAWTAGGVSWFGLGLTALALALLLRGVGSVRVIALCAVLGLVARTLGWV